MPAQQRFKQMTSTQESLSYVAWAANAVSKTSHCSQESPAQLCCASVHVVVRRRLRSQSRLSIVHERIALLLQRCQRSGTYSNTQTQSPSAAEASARSETHTTETHDYNYRNHVQIANWSKYRQAWHILHKSPKNFHVYNTIIQLSITKSVLTHTYSRSIF